MQPSRQNVSKATVFAVCAPPHVLEETGSEIRRRVCVNLSPSVIRYDTIHSLVHYFFRVLFYFYTTTYTCFSPIVLGNISQPVHVETREIIGSA